MQIFSRLRRRWFPTKEERFDDGLAFARKHFAGCQTEAEVEMLFEGLPIDRSDPFDDAVTAYYLVRCRELR